MTSKENRARWLAFATLCVGDLMIVLDSTIVNVALPSIRESLGFSETSLVWVVNAYILTYGGFMLLGGRLADLYGPRKVFLIGIVAFTIASVACGLSTSSLMLVIARAFQGLGGAVVTAVCLALIVSLFPDRKERVRAMGFYGFIMAGGGSIGVLVGGLLTGGFSWHWVFLVNIPIGIAVALMTPKLIPFIPGIGAQRLDLGGAVTITGSLVSAVYAIVGGADAGWASFQTLGLLAVSIVLFIAFLIIESRTVAPLVPLGLFKLRNVATANVVAVFWAAAMFAWFFLAALYLQLVLGYDPMQVGLAFLPSNLIMAAFSFNLSAMTVNRFGIRGPAAVGLGIAALGLFLFGFAPADGNFWLHVLPGMVLLGFGGGMAFNPVLLAAMSDVGPDQSGLASGAVNTAYMMGGALGLAVLVAVAASGTSGAVAAGLDDREALNVGYQMAFFMSAAFAAVAAALCRLRV